MIGNVGSRFRGRIVDPLLPLGPLAALVLLDGVLQNPEQHPAEFVDGHAQGQDALIVAELIDVGKVIGLEELLRGKAAKVF